MAMQSTWKKPTTFGRALKCHESEVRIKPMKVLALTIAHARFYLLKVFKVESKEDGCLYAVKKSRVRFRGEFDRYCIFKLLSKVSFENL